jgi:hypothetical protein
MNKIKQHKLRTTRPGHVIAGGHTQISSLAVLLSSLVGTLAPSTAGAMGNPVTPPPPTCNTVVNLPNCQVYLTSDGYCESLVKTQCQDVVSQAHAAERATIADSRNVLPAGQEASNTTVAAKYIKDSMADHRLDGVDSMYVANNMSSDIGAAQGKADRLAAILDNPCTRAANAAGAPNQICSCGQYAYDTYYSARPFERKVSQSGLDYRAIYNQAQSLANTNISSKDNLYQTAFVPHQVGRSRYHDLNSWTLAGQYPAGTTDKFVWDSALRSAYDNTYKTYTLNAAKHAELSNALAAIPDEKLNYLFDQQIQFADDLAYRNKRWAAFQARAKDLTAGSPELAQLSADTAAELKALDAKLQEGLQHGKDLGCVPAAINNVTACDWSPHFFYADAQGYFSKLGEDRYQQCVQLTGDYFGNTPQAALANTLAFSNHLTTQNGTVAKLSSVSSAIDSTPTLGQQFSDEGQYGNDDFNVKYDYNFSWGITDYNQKDANGNAQFCKSNLRGGGKFGVTGTVFSVSKQVVDFNAWAFTKTEQENNQDKDYLHEQLSMKILDENLFSPIDAKQQANYAFVSSPSKKLGKDGNGYSMSKTFIVVAVPVTVKGGLTGSFGVDIKLQAGIIRDCVGLPDQMNIGVSSHLKPYVDLDAYLSAGIGWSGLSAGVKGEVNLIEVELPFNAEAGLKFMATNTGSDLFLASKADLNLLLRTLRGKVSVYIEYIVGSSEKEIFSWNGYEVKSKLFDFDARYPLIQIANMPTTTAN